ncbi:MAG: sulfur carrier protein ThiS [Verrucomicrobiales bacterium]|jgi:thiamine biosynthesis protein ThiS
MQITLNGQVHPLPEPTTVTGLLLSLGFADKPVVVELNREAIFPRDFNTTPVNDRDLIEIVTLAAGG